MANQAGAANTWTESRSDAMGGTGVASGSYGSGALINPALLAKAKPDDDVTVILPSVGAQITDEDNLQDEIDNINDKINHYKDVVDNLTPREIITNPLGSINQFQGAAKDLADELDYLKGKTARATAGAGLAVSIPNDVLSVAFMAKGYAHGRVSSSIDQQDIDYLPYSTKQCRGCRCRAGRCAEWYGSDHQKPQLNGIRPGGDCLRLRCCCCPSVRSGWRPGFRGGYAKTAKNLGL
jgi:hypothetical protein